MLDAAILRRKTSTQLDARLGLGSWDFVDGRAILWFEYDRNNTTVALIPKMM